eukprot:scaffold66368_cov66-Phaeocystis_antarctica.AAC.4
MRCDSFSVPVSRKQSGRFFYSCKNEMFRFLPAVGEPRRMRCDSVTKRCKHFEMQCTPGLRSALLEVRYAGPRRGSA